MSSSANASPRFVKTWEELPSGEWLDNDEHGTNWYQTDDGVYWHSTDNGFAVWDEDDTESQKNQVDLITYDDEMDDEDSAGTDYEAEFMAISFAVNDNLSVSYGRQDTEKSGDIDEQEVTGFSVGYSMGGMTVTAHNNESDNHNNVLNATSDHTEISLTFAF